MSKLICIDAGHGGTDSGAVGNDVKEKDVALKVAKRVGEMLQKYGFKVIYTRITDNYINLGERCKIANSYNADLFVSVHINSATNEQANGTETLCYSKNRLAELIQGNMLSKLRLKDRGVKERKDLYVLNSTQMTAVLCELAFLSNREEAEFIKTDRFLELSAEAITIGICEYFGVKFKSENDIKERSDTILKKIINVEVNGKKEFTEGYFADNRNLFTADFIRQLGFDVECDSVSKVVKISPKTLKLDVNGKKINVETVNIAGNNFCSLRNVAAAVGCFKVTGYEKDIVYIDSK